MSKHEIYSQIEKTKRQLATAKKMKAPQTAINTAKSKIDRLTEQLNEMIIDANCKVKYRSKVSNDYLEKRISLSFSNIQNIFDDILENSYERNDNGEFDSISDSQYKILLLNKWKDKIYSIKVTDEVTENNVLNLKSWFKSLPYEQEISKGKNILAELIQVMETGKMPNKNTALTKLRDEMSFNTRIFINKKGFILFNKLIEAMPLSSDNMAYIYRILIEDKFMFRVTQDEYRDLLLKDYGISLDKIKTLVVLKNKYRNKIYNTALSSIQ